jgi:hypothetical protein
MKLSNLFVLTAVASLASGILLMLVPGVMANLCGANADPIAVFAAQLFGVELFAAGLISWLVRNVSDRAAQGAILVGFMCANVMGTIVALAGTLSGVVNALGWLVVAFYLLFALGDAYFHFVMPSSS